MLFPKCLRGLRGNREDIGLAGVKMKIPRVSKDLYVPILWVAICEIKRNIAIKWLVIWEFQESEDAVDWLRSYVLNLNLQILIPGL